MKALTLRGPWANYELQKAEHETKIASLEAQLLNLSKRAEEATSALRESEHQRVCLANGELTVLREENQRARALLAKLDNELRDERKINEDRVGELESKLSAAIGELKSLNSENASLRQELSKTVQVRGSTHSKLDEARRRLGLSASEAQVFIKEFDEASRSNKLLRQELSSLQADRVQIQQQCESRSQHCMVLIAENKRLGEQVTELRRQLVEMDQEGWRLRQQISAASQRQLHLQQKREQAATACKNRPQWQCNTAPKPKLADQDRVVDPSGNNNIEYSGPKSISRRVTADSSTGSNSLSRRVSADSCTKLGQQLSREKTVPHPSREKIIALEATPAQQWQPSKVGSEGRSLILADVTNRSSCAAKMHSSEVKQKPRGGITDVAGVNTTSTISRDNMDDSSDDPLNVQVIRQALELRRMQKEQLQLQPVDSDDLSLSDKDPLSHCPLQSLAEEL